MKRVGPWLDPEYDEVNDPSPYEYPQAKRAVARASRDQQAATDFTANSADDFAEAERAYRVALAKKMVDLHNDGVAWSTVGDLARGDDSVAELKKARDIAEGVQKAAEQLAWKASANRRALEQLVSWSMKVNLGGDE